MSETVIRVENLGKKYVIGHEVRERGRYVTLREVIADKVRHLFAFGRNGKMNPRREEIWALKGVSFEVKQGERLGIIGRNGAGKSTLLKVLSRITEPTTGKISIKGRVASLLEVGTGFHPELTGRENIYLNGAILGMSKTEIRKKFDEIVDFAEIEKFLDTPVKRYSSGMYVRLAFAVAAHLEPDVLLVDEVLAVGDAEFQKKCLGKMEDVSREQGRTVLFVSHNLAAVEALCGRSVLLGRGGLVLDSNTANSIDSYLEESRRAAKSGDLRNRTDRKGSEDFLITGIRIWNDVRAEVSTLKTGEDYLFEFEYENRSDKDFDDVCVSFDIYDQRGVRLLLFRTNLTGQNLNLRKGVGKFYCRVDKFPLVYGQYFASIFVSHHDAELLDFVEQACELTVEAGDFFGNGHPGYPNHCRTLYNHAWSTNGAH